MKKLVLLLIMPLLAMTAWAQKYHDAALEQIKGNPKEVRITHDGKVQTITYDADGKAHKDGWTDAVYDDKGYMTSCNISQAGVSGKCRMTYNTKGQIVRLVIEMEGTPVTTDFTYDSNGMLKSEAASVNIPFLGKTKKTIMTWTYNSFDDHGNWTRRTGKVMGKKATQTRTIVYW